MSKNYYRFNNLFYFSFFNIIDKFFIFFFPFYIYFLTNDKTLYNDIEYIFSISPLLIIFFELGIKNYFFYGYKITKDRNQFISSIQSLFNLMILFYSMILIIVLSLDFDSTFLSAFILIKIIQTMVMTFYFSYFRIIDKPSKIFSFSIPFNMLLYIFVYFLFSKNYVINIQSVNYIPFVALICFNLFFLQKPSHFLKKSKLIKRSLLYSWPIMLNLLFMAFINQFGKIYAFNFLIEDEMFELSLVQRIASIILLTHTSIMGFFTKTLFLSKNNVFHKKIFLFYSLAITLSATILVFIASLANSMNLFEINMKLLILFVAGTVLWCYNSYFEIYFNSNNRNRYVPVITCIAFIMYMIIFLLSDEISILRISEIYLYSNLTGFFATMYFLTKIKT